ncbi:hypothetical protein [Salinihabitans flavidus]|nr:hypothetical protein [Salinihabitans flavidus]
MFLMVLSKFFRQKPSIVFSLDDAASFLRAQGFAVEPMEERMMGDTPMQRYRVRRGTSAFILTSDGRVLTFLSAVKLGDGWTDMDILKWNTKKSYMTFTYSPEGNMAILKHHCFISGGLPAKTLHRLAEIWVAFLPKFLTEMSLSESDVVRM